MRFRACLSEYYNFGRIEPGRHGCFFGLENGHLRPSTIIFSRCAALMKAAPHGARGKSSLTWGAARQNPRFLRKTDSSSDFHYLRPLRRPCWMACGPLTLKNVRGVLGRTLRAGVWPRTPPIPPDPTRGRSGRSAQREQAAGAAREELEDQRARLVRLSNLQAYNLAFH